MKCLIVSHRQAMRDGVATRAGARRRFEQMANSMLADTTIAGQEAVVDYLAGAAALEQWAQAALALLLLRASPAPLAAEQLAAAVEALLEQRFQARRLGRVQVLGLGFRLARTQQLSAALKALLELRFYSWCRVLSSGSCHMGWLGACQAQVRIRFDAEEALGELQRLGLLAPDERASGGAAPRYSVLGYGAAYERLAVHWDSLLLRRMGSILSTVQ